MGWKAWARAGGEHGQEHEGNTPKPPRNAKDKLMRETWLLQGHCKPWLLNSFRRNPKRVLPFCGFIANSFLGKEGSVGTTWPQSKHFFLLPGCARKLSPGTQKLRNPCERADKGKTSRERVWWVWGCMQGTVGGLAFSRGGQTVCFILRQGTCWIFTLFMALVWILLNSLS